MASIVPIQRSAFARTLHIIERILEQVVGKERFEKAHDRELASYSCRTWPEPIGFLLGWSGVRLAVGDLIIAVMYVSLQECNYVV